MPAADDTVVRTTARRREVDEWALVLSAAAIPHRVEGAPGLWRIVVASDDASRAAAALDAFEREEAKGPMASLAVAEWGPTWAGVAMAAMLVLVDRLARAPGAGGRWLRSGSANAVRLLHGEPWRAVTALTLHADASHLLGNAVAGALLATMVCRLVGPGIGAWLVLSSGALGNVATAFVTAPHDAIGASTAVLGAVGVLSGLAVVRARHGPGVRGRAWVALGAGLALLAMLAGIGVSLALPRVPPSFAIIAVAAAAYLATFVVRPSVSRASLRR